MDILDLLQPNSSFSVDMVKNSLTIDGAVINTDFPLSFNCNWSNETVIKVLERKILNADVHNVSYKDPNDKSKKVDLPIYESVLLKTENYDIISVGYYHN